MPNTISEAGSEAILRYVYLADGTKFTVGDYDRAGLAYRGSLVYYQDLNRISGLESAGFGSGRITEASRGQEIGYFLTDHLGSTRVIVNDNSARVAERNDYHPFGSVWQDPQHPVSLNRYKFSGKEIQPDARSPYLDFGARFYDPVSLIWTGQDPLAEKYHGISPYAYCANNPVRFSDSDGRKIVDTNGTEVWTKNGGWTKNAPEGTQRIGNAMMLSKTGTATWEQMSDSSAAISLSMSSESKQTKEGNIALGIAKTKIKGDRKTVKITIYEGSISEYVRSDKTYSDNEKQEMMRNSTPEERVGAVATHEGTHAVDDKRDKKRETRAVANEKAYLKEVEIQKPITNQEIKNNLFQ